MNFSTNCAILGRLEFILQKGFYYAKKNNQSSFDTGSAFYHFANIPLICCCFGKYRA